MVREKYVNTVSELSPSDSAGRTAAKVAARENTSPLGKAMAEAMRPIAEEGTRTGGTASKTNPGVNKTMQRVSMVGRGMIVAGALISINNVVSAPEAQRGLVIVMSQEAGAWVGAWAFGSAGALGGGVVGAPLGPPGMAAGALGGGIAGSIGGSMAGAQAAENIYIMVQGDVP